MTTNFHLSNQVLREGTVHVFCLAVPSGFGQLDLPTDRVARILTASELERFHRYRIQCRRNDLVLSRIMLQVILGKLGVAANDPWWIEADASGKPYAMSMAGRADCHLNTSDTSGMITWVISRHGPLGCDVETIAEDKDEVAERSFSSVELADYRALVAVKKQHRFYEIWTLKEAVLKADGRGLAIPLYSFQFCFDDDHGNSQPSFEVIDGERGPVPEPWRFHSFRPLGTHRAAVAVFTSAAVAFDCYILHLAEFDADLIQPWRFVLDVGNDYREETVEFGVFNPVGPGHGI